VQYAFNALHCLFDCDWTIQTLRLRVAAYKRLGMDMPHASFINGTCLISLMLSWRSETSNSPQPLVSCSTLSLVTPGKMVPSKGGVTSSRVLPSAYSSMHQCHSAAECCEEPKPIIWKHYDVLIYDSSVFILKTVHRGTLSTRQPSDVFRCMDTQSWVT